MTELISISLVLAFLILYAYIVNAANLFLSHYLPGILTRPVFIFLIPMSCIILIKSILPHFSDLIMDVKYVLDILDILTIGSIILLYFAEYMLPVKDYIFYRSHSLVSEGDLETINVNKDVSFVVLKNISVNEKYFGSNTQKAAAGILFALTAKVDYTIKALPVVKKDWDKNESVKFWLMQGPNYLRAHYRHEPVSSHPEPDVLQALIITEAREYSQMKKAIKQAEEMYGLRSDKNALLLKPVGSLEDLETASRPKLITLTILWIVMWILIPLGFYIAFLLM